MADRTYLWGGRNSTPRRATDHGGRRRHDQQRLLVELELDDSLYQGTLRAGIEQNAPRHSDGASDRPADAASTSHNRHLPPSYDQDFIAEPKPRSQSRTPHDTAAKPRTERQMQQLHAKRLSSPYKLKQQVLGTRNDPTPRRYQQQSPHNESASSTQRVIRSSALQQSPAQLVIESIRQNMHLRDQVMAHLQQELMGVLPLHRASHVEKNVPQRVVKLLNRMRSLSLAVVETVVYLSSELGDSNVVGVSVEHEILEQDFYGYLQQMASSDTDFLACSPPLQRFFEDFEVNLTRNPFVDGLSLDSSEVLLCSCHQSASSRALFCSASSSSSSLLRLLMHKLETFALQAQRYLLGWQILPVERVAAALLHLMDLETRFNAVRMLPRYLQSHNDSRKYSHHQLHQQRGQEDTSYGYGTFEDERIQRLDHHDSQVSRTGGYDPTRGEISVMEAWAGSPTSKIPIPSQARPPSSRVLTPPLPNESARSVLKKEENSRTPSLASSVWTQNPRPSDLLSGRTAAMNSSLSVSPPPLRKMSTRGDSAGSEGTAGNDGGDNVALSRLVLSSPMFDAAAKAKSSSQAERSASRKRSGVAIEKCDDRSKVVDAGIQMSEPPTSVATPKDDIPTTKGSARNTSARSMQDEAIRVSSEENSEPETLPASPRVERLVLSRDRIDGEPSELINAVGTPTTEDHDASSVEYEVEGDGEAATGNDDGYECDFEYSSNDALSSIALALQMLPNFSLSNMESTLVDEGLKPEEAIPPIELGRMGSSRTEEHETDDNESTVVPIATGTLLIVNTSPASTRGSTQYEVGISMERVSSELESVEQRAEMPPQEDDEYAYSSSTAVSNIAMALSLLPSVWRDDVFSVPEQLPEDQSESQLDIDSPRISTYRSIEDDQSRPEEPWQASSPQIEEMLALFSPSAIYTSIPESANDQAMYSLHASSRSYSSAPTSERTGNSSPVSSRSDFPAVTNDDVVHSIPASSRSNVSAATGYQGDDESEPSEFKRIFALCRDIQVAAYDMSHWVSQREVEDHIQSVAQPFSSIMGYSSPTTTKVQADNTPKYLERELKMLRRNFTSWKVACAEQKRAKLVVRGLVATLKVRQFVLHHRHRHLQARIDQENHLRFLAASLIQLNWRIYRHNQGIAKRKAGFRAVHMAFHRTLLFVGISRRRRRREYAKEKVVRWWRHQRLRIKKEKQRQEHLGRERERRTRARRDIQRFLKEILLRRKLKAAQEMTKSILFKEQLKWTKAKRDEERSTKLNLKHRRELIADMNARLADLDRRWKVSEQERLQLLTHHERVVQQQQHTVEVRRRRLAALKIQMFFRLCVLHKKLQKVESEKKQFETKVQEELRRKEVRGVETQKRMGKTRTQVRVLERKVGRMSQQALQTDVRHREIVQAHQEREGASQERAARLKIKAFIHARTLCSRAESERRKLLLEQARLQSEKTEIELMSSEDQLEQRRTALSIASTLQQRLSELEARSEELLTAKHQLAAEKELEAQQAAAALEHSRVEARMQQIASWVSGQMQLSKLKKEQDAIRASAAHAMEEEKRRQRTEIEAKMREVSSIKASAFMHQRMSQQRNKKTVEMIRIQQQEKSAQEKVVAGRTRAQLVQIIIDVKLLTEREGNRGITQGLDGVARFYKAQKHKFARLKCFRSINCARKIQRGWRRWMHQLRIKRTQALALAQLEEAKRRQALARRLQVWWRKWVQEQQRRHEQQLVFNARLEEIRVRVNVRKIQGAWRRWVKCENERRQQQRLVFEAHLEGIRLQANARRIQGTWRRWVQRERERRNQQQLAFDAHLEAIRIRATVRKIQRVWRRWIRCEQERRNQQQLAFDAHLESIRVRATVRKIQSVWRRWVKCNQERRERRRIHELEFSCTLHIQRWWRKWQQEQRDKAERIRMLRNASAQVVQRKWKRWRQWQLAEKEKQRLRIERESCARKLQKLWRQWCWWKRSRELSAKRIQERWEKWQKEKMEAERVRKTQMMAALRIQRNWRQWQCKRRYEMEKTRKRIRQEIGSAMIHDACCHWWQRKQKVRNEIRAVERIQRRWRQRSLEKTGRECQENEQRAIALKIQQNWTGKRFRRNKDDVARKRCLGAQRIQRKWRRWHHRKEVLQARKRAQVDQHMSAMLLQRARKKWHVAQRERTQLNPEQERRAAAVLVIQTQWQKTRQCELEKRLVQTQNASSVKIQRNWGKRQHRRRMEQGQVQHEQHMAALKIQTLWLKWYHGQQEELERERIRQEQYESSVKIQRNWGISHQRRRVTQERLRHKQNINALKIQKHWRRWWHLRLEQRNRSKTEDAKPRKPRSSLTEKLRPDAERLQRDEHERQEQVDVITQRSYGRRIAGAVKRYLKTRREASAATKIEAIWKGTLYRTHYLDALGAKRAEEARQYRLLVSVLATKVQLCWRRWHKGVRQVKRAVVKDDELRLIQEAKALERKVLAARRALAAKRIQRALASRRKLIATKGVSHREVVQKEEVLEHEELSDKASEEEPVDQPQNEEPAGNLQEPAEAPVDQPGDLQEVSKEDLARTTVEMTVEDWSHRELPHILTRSMNQVLFCHEAANVLQRRVREYQRRQQMNFYFQCSFAAISARDPGYLDGKMHIEHFHFYFKRASGWLDWDRSSSDGDTNQAISPLRLRLDSQMTRKLLQLFEPSEEYLPSEIHQVLQEIAADALPIFQSPVYLKDNGNARSELCYHDVEEMELPLPVKLLRQMGQYRAQMRRQQLLEVEDTNSVEASVLLPSPDAKSVPSPPTGKSAPSSPSQRTKKELTIFTAVDNASVEDAIFLQQRGADLGALEPKTQRNALHMLSFSKENYRSRAEMLEFLLRCDAKLNVNAVDCNGDTPLMLYASLGHLDFMQKLLEHEADILKTNNRGQNVLHRACEEDQVEICGFLQQLMMKDSIAEDVVPVETISKLAPAELSLHTPDSTGRYPLLCLVDKGFVECAKQLVVPTEANDEWNRVLQAQGDPQGRTALHLAVLAHDAAMTAFLLTPGGGSNVNASDDLHRSPLHYAVESPAALPIISRLVQHGANVNVADERGDTPLHWAAFSGRAAVAQNLMALGADPRLANTDWETPAQIAAAYGQLDCMRLLLQSQRRYGATSTGEPKDQQQQPGLNRPASEKTALQRLEEAVNHLHQRQASAHSCHAGDQDTDLNTNGANSEHEASLAEQSHGGYWEELHQDVQLVEESGQFSSEDEDDLLFGYDDNDLSF